MIKRLAKAVLALIAVAASPAEGAIPASTDISILHAERIGPSLTLDGEHIGSHDVSGWRNLPPTLEVRFEAFGRQFELELELETNSRITEHLTSAASDRVDLYRGHIAGDTLRSWARLSMISGGITGLIWDGREMYAIEAAEDIYRQAAPGALQPSIEPVIFRLSDVRIDPRALNCAVGSVTPKANGLDSYRALVEELSEILQFSGSAFQIDIGLVADFEFVQFFGDDSEAELLARMNLIDGIFSEQVGTRLNVPQVKLFGTSSDPFSGSDAENLLDQLGSYKDGTPESRDHGVLHLFSRRDLNDDVIGIAYVDALCSPRFGVSLSENRRAMTTDALIAAHEIGHNFGAVHDGTPGEACSTTPESFLMAPHYNGSSTFSTCSVDTMRPRIAAAACASALLDADVSIEAEEDPYSVVSQSRFQYSIVVRNLGIEEATGVNASIVLPDSFQIFNATADGGDCTSATGQVDCYLGQIPGNSPQTITLDLEAVQDGEYSIDLIVAADRDNDPLNNQRVASIVVADRADLHVTLTEPNLIVLGEQTTVAAQVANLGESDATDVMATIAIPPAGEVIDISSTDSICELGTGEIVCRLDSLPENRTERIAYTLSTTELGSFRVEAAASAAELDPDEANNSAQINLVIVETLVDLGVSMNSDQNVYHAGDSAQVNAFVFNSVISRGDAAGVQVDVELPLGFVLSSTELIRSTGQCALTGRVLHCDIDRVPLGEDIAVSMNFRISTAQRPGQYEFGTSATSIGADLNTADNSAVYSVRVSASSPTPAAGGGGALGGPACWLLLWLLARRRVKV